jgi:hypothetical protein
MLAEARPGRGESNTPFPGKICTDAEQAVYKVAAVGVDQIRFVLMLSGDSARFCESLTEHDYRPRGMPSMRMVGAWMPDGPRRKFVHFLGEDGPRLLYHRDSASLHVDLHFGELVPVTEGVRRAKATVERLDRSGVASVFPARVARADFTGDVLFRTPAHFRYVLSAFAAMLPERGRVMEPFKSSTLYLNASRASRSKRLGRVYDKGHERASVAGWTFPPERYMRIEAERLWETDRPALEEVDSDTARTTFCDRFGSVGRGTLVLKSGLAEPLMDLLRSDAITTAQYEQLYCFLDLHRIGLASEVYGRDTFARRMRLARSLGLETPTEELDDAESALDVRVLVQEIADAF